MGMLGCGAWRSLTFESGWRDEKRKGSCAVECGQVYAAVPGAGSWYDPVSMHRRCVHAFGRAVFAVRFCGMRVKIGHPGKDRGKIERITAENSGYGGPTVSPVWQVTHFSFALRSAQTWEVSPSSHINLVRSPRLPAAHVHHTTLKRTADSKHGRSIDADDGTASSR